MTKTKAYLLAVGTFLGGLAPLGVQAAGFTDEQAKHGRSLYAAQCAQCHGANLEGTDAPALSDETMQNFGTVAGLFDMISVAMPPQTPGELGEQAYLDIIAFILLGNGALPGSETLVMDYDALETMDLVALIEEGRATQVATVDATPETASDVPQAYTWGKPLPGSDLFAEAAEAAPSGVPQAYTWGKELPTANQ